MMVQFMFNLIIIKFIMQRYLWMKFLAKIISKEK